MQQKIKEEEMRVLRGDTEVFLKIKFKDRLRLIWWTIRIRRFQQNIRKVNILMT